MLKIDPDVPLSCVIDPAEKDPASVENVEDFPFCVMTEAKSGASAVLLTSFADLNASCAEVFALAGVSVVPARRSDLALETVLSVENGTEVFLTLLCVTLCFEDDGFPAPDVLVKESALWAVEDVVLLEAVSTVTVTRSES